METGRAWLVLSLGDEREYAGNVGYADELEKVYRYDSFVPNHKQINEGDLLILCNKKYVLGLARISRIESYEGRKTFSRCPKCEVATIKERKRLRPRFRCKARHTFDSPVKTQKPCTHYAAWFDGAFEKARENVPVGHVRRACLRYNGQLAMQEVAPSRLGPAARGLLRQAMSLAEVTPDTGLRAEDAVVEPYVPDSQDERDSIARQIRARRGQKAFRQALRKRFKDTCLVTRCRVPDLLEAAHIAPYRGEKDNHPSNGLLLRADIHTLFDLNLLGIDPETLKVSLHAKVKGMGYDDYEGALLACDTRLLSSEALKSRWRKFQSR